MTYKKIIVSENDKVLVKALEEFLKENELDLEIIKTKLASNENQMLDNEETIQVAVDNAINLYEGIEDSISIGMKEGLHYNIFNKGEVETLGQYTLQDWVAVYDGIDIYFGSSPAFPIPYKVGVEISEKGISPSEYLSKLIKDQIDESNGFVGKLTQNKVTRHSHLKDALMSALSPLFGNLK